MARKAAPHLPDPVYFRQQAERARRLADAIGNKPAEAELRRMAREYDARADELESRAKTADASIT